MKLSQILAGAATMALVAGVASSAFAAPGDVGPGTQTFSITGHVVTACIVNFPTTSMNVGTIPINTTGSTAASTYFTVSPSTVIQGSILDGSAGCNTNNNVTISKANGATGLHNATTSAYSTTVFTANLPYNIEASWNGEYQGAPITTPIQQTVVSTPTQGTGQTIPTGAFASNVAIFLFVPDPTLALLAGDYTDSVTLTFTAS